MVTVKSMEEREKFWPLVEELWLVRLCVYIYAENEATLSVGIWWRENKNKLVQWKALVDTVGITSVDLKDKLLF